MADEQWIRFVIKSWIKKPWRVDVEMLEVYELPFTLRAQLRNAMDREAKRGKKNAVERTRLLEDWRVASRGRATEGTDPEED